MGQHNQSSSALSVTILAVIIAVGLMCLIGVMVVAGFLVFGVSYRAQPTYLSAPATLAPAPVVSRTPLPNPQYPVPSTLTPPTMSVNGATVPSPTCDPNESQVKISFSADGEIVLDGEQLDIDQLIEPLSGDGKTTHVTMNVHPDATFGQIETVRQRLRQAGHGLTLQLDKDDSTSEPE